MSGKKKSRPDDYLFTIVEASTYLNVSPQTIRRKIWDGKIKFTKPFNRILIRKKDLDRYLKAN